MNIPVVDLDNITVDGFISVYDLKFEREPWQIYFMRKAELVASRTTCKSRSVGAVFVRDKADLISGYNGVPANYPHPTTCARKEAGCKAGERLDLCPCNHAEANAINLAAREGIRLKDSVLYCTSKPCQSCMGSLSVVGIRAIIYLHPYPHEVSTTIAKHGNIELYSLYDALTLNVM